MHGGKRACSSDAVARPRWPSDNFTVGKGTDAEEGGLAEAHQARCMPTSSSRLSAKKRQ
jgi:hypothetical protein